MSALTFSMDKWPRRLAWIVAVATLILFTGSAFFSYLSEPRTSSFSWQNWAGGVAIGSIYMFAFMLTGLLIILRPPGNRYGWLLLLMSFFWMGWRGFFDSFGVYLYNSGESHWLVALLAHFAGYGWLLGYLTLAFALLWFPTGGDLSPRWRVVGWLALLSMGFAIIGSTLRPGELAFIAQIENPFGLTGALAPVIEIFFWAGTVLLLCGLLLGIVSVVVRFSRSQGVERQQIKWFAFAAVLLGLGLLVDNWTELPGNWETLKETLIFCTLPLAVGIAILRYRLYDIDVIIRRTLVYGALTLTLAAVYFGSVVLLQSVFTAVSGQGSAVAIVISTLVIAALFTPLRRRIQNDIDRRFYRKKYDAEKVVAAFGASLREEVDLEELRARLLSVVEETMQPEYVSLWLKLAAIKPTVNQRSSSSHGGEREQSYE